MERAAVGHHREGEPQFAQQAAEEGVDPLAAGQGAERAVEAQVGVGDGDPVVPCGGGLARLDGLFVSTQKNVTRPGSSGAAEISATMDRLRASPPTHIGPHAVSALTDIQRGVRVEGGRETRVDLPPSNVLVFELDGGARVVARPSGTEPKIKYYLDLRETVAPGEPFAAARARAEASLTALADAWMAIVDAR